MSTPASLSPSPLHSLGGGAYTAVLEDDYAVGKSNFKLKAVTKAGGTVNYKVTKADGKKDLAQEVKVQFPWENRYLWLGVRGDNQWKVHADLGEFDFVTKQRVFASATQAGVYKFGSVFSYGNFLVHQRLARAKNGNWRGLVRGAYKNGNFTFNWVNHVDFDEGRFVNDDHQVQYTRNNTQFFFRWFADQSLFSNPFGSRYHFDVVHKFDKHQVAAEVSYDLDKLRPGVVVGGQTTLYGFNVKARVNLLEKTVGFVSKRKLNDTVSITNSWDSSKPQATGVTVEFNI